LGSNHSHEIEDLMKGFGFMPERLDKILTQARVAIKRPEFGKQSESLCNLHL
jgi:hypothetical protein